MTENPSEIADILNLATHEDGRPTIDYDILVDAASHVLAAGYRKPRTITTAEELDELPEGTILEADGRAHQKASGAFWGTDGGWLTSKQLAKDAPLTILHSPDGV